MTGPARTGMMRSMRTPTRSRLAALALVACTATPALAKAPAGPLTATEKKLVQRIDHRLPESLALLERAVNINSGTSNHAGVREVGKLFTAELDAMGFTTRWVDGAGFGRAGHLVAERGTKAGAPKIVLVGHLDTVFEPDSPFQRFQHLDDSTATGPGVIDMKGGDVILLLALRALHDTHELDRFQICVVMTGDEESPGRPIDAARAALVAAARGADAAIGFEDGDGDPQHVIVSRRGSSNWTLRVRGTPSHSSLVFTADVGIGAIYEAARLLERFRDTLQVEPYLTFNPGLVLGGTAISQDSTGTRGTAFGKTNVVAETTVVTGDLRAITLEQRERARAVMQGIVAGGSPRTSATIEFDDGYPPLAPTDGNRRLLAMVDRASHDLGFGALTSVDPARAGAADVSFLAGTVPMVIDAMGLKGSGGHTVLETARLGTLAVQAKRVAVTLSRLARQAPQQR
jgi:glutamate carboxypeptidase